jgi:nucleotide-binding universal stress UspA family protein
MASQDILVPTDFGRGSRAALERALDSLEPDGGRISVLHVLDQRLTEHALSLFPDTQASALLTRLQHQAQQRYDELVAGLEVGNAELQLLTVEGIPFLKIVQLARDLDVDMIVMTVHRSTAHFEQFLFGSNAERVLRMTPCPVLIVPETDVADEP